jgi:hypothetical protein
LDGPANSGAGGRHFGGGDPDHARRSIAALPVRDADDEINTLAREINTMLDKIEQLTWACAPCSTAPHTICARR